MMFYLRVNEGYAIFNVSTKLTAYGYIYYASLSTGNSYALLFAEALLAVIGIVSTVVMIVAHLCAIGFAHNHLYKSVHLRVNRPNITTPAPAQRFTDLRRNLTCTLSRWIGWCLVGTDCCTRSRTCCRKSAVNKPTDRDSNAILTPSDSTIVLLPKLLDDDSTPTLLKPTSYPGVSIIKPLTGIDPNLEVNLASYFGLDYPNYEILFCVSEEADPSCELVRQLQVLYPQIPSKLIIADRVVGVNPKINNLQSGYESAQFDLLLISDSGIWMRPDTLSDMVSALTSDDKTGMVHQVPFMAPHLTASECNCRKSAAFMKCKPFFYQYAQESHHCDSHIRSRRPSFAWIVQLVFFGCWHAKIYMCSGFFGINCTTGMSCLMRKSVLVPLGGFQQFGRYLAEDFFLARYFIDQGWKIRLSRQPAWQNSPSATLSQFRLRIGRWSQLRLSMVVIAYLLEPFSRCLPNAFLGAFAFTYFLPEFIDPGVYFLCYILIWFILDYILLLQMYPPCLSLCITKFEFLVAWFFSELTAVPFHLDVFCKKDLHWRNKRFRVHWGGVSEQIIPQIIAKTPETQDPFGDASSNDDVCHDPFDV